MRLISQDRMIDVPYEYGSLCQGFIKGEEHLIYTISYYNYSSQRGTKLAEYSSKDKALKVVEMLREKYLSRMELDGGYDEVHGCYVQPNFWVLPRVFQFPADEEVVMNET